MSSMVGLFGGIAAGAALWGFGGAVVLGVLGFVVAQTSSRLAALEARLARLEGTAPEPTAPERAVSEAGPATQTSAATTPERTIPTPAPAPRRAAPIGAPRLKWEPPAARETPRPPRETAPARPNPVLAWITGGNTIVRVGLVILFVGLAFLLKFAADRRILPDELKVALVGASGVALLILGWRLRAARRGYAISLQGAGVAVLYLTILVAMRLYGLVPPVAAFVMLALIAVFAATLAVAQDALVLAVIAAGGGFLAPILVSTGEGDHVTLFSYYLVLNLGLVMIAWHKSWRVLNVLGFAFTFVIGLAWGLRSYTPELFATTEPFLVAFFLLYVLIAVLFARRQAPALRNYVDGTIVVGTPLAAFALQAGLTRGMEFGLAYSSLAAAALYVTLAAALQRVGRATYRLLTESFLAMGVVFATLAIPLALDARWTSAAWAIEGAAIYWIGVRQRTPLARAFALLVQLLSGAAFVNAYPRLASDLPVVGAAFIGALLIAVAGLFTNRLMHRVAGDDAISVTERRVAPVAFLWGFGWLAFAGINETDAFLTVSQQPMANVALFTALAALFAGLHRRWEWPEARWPLLGLVPMLALLALASAIVQPHPLARFGWIAWPFAFVAHTVMLRRLEPQAEGLRRWFGVLHAGAYLLLAALGAWELNWAAAQVTSHDTTWSVSAVLLVPAVLVFWAASARWDARWPLSKESFGGPYRGAGALTILVLMVAWVLYANFTHDGSSDPLPYLPLINAIDLGHLLVGLCATTLVLAGRRTGQPAPGIIEGTAARAAGAVLAFLWLNAILLRSIHHWAGVPYDLDDMIDSVLVQSALSVFWAFLALTVMVWATRRAVRTPWMVGAGLMAVVVAKLFLVDLSNIHGVERIVSFIGVGVLMLVIGYFSPVPPRRAGAGGGGPAEGIA